MNGAVPPNGLIPPPPSISPDRLVQPSFFLILSVAVLASSIKFKSTQVQGFFFVLELGSQRRLYCISVRPSKCYFLLFDNSYLLAKATPQ